jgi:hypothetical protein
LWKLAFGGDPYLVGQSITIDGKPRTVVGVLPPEFRLNHEVIPAIGGIDKAEIFLPLPMDAKQELDYGPEDYNVLARLKPGDDLVAESPSCLVKRLTLVFLR